jgi:hypothetical protein
MSSIITITTAAELTQYSEMIKDAARKAHLWIAQQTDDPIGFLRSVKFEKIGYDPITHEKLNLIEQVNQTWTYTVALKATEHLMAKHRDAGGFTLAPGATASQELDIMSVKKGLVGAETFAATSPGSNGKLQKDLKKLHGKGGAYEFRYVFFAAPTHPTKAQITKHSSNFPGIEVWSLPI